MALEINSDTIAEAVVSRLKDSAVLAPRLLTLNQAAMYLGLTPDALKANITDETDTQEAGRKAEEFLAREHQEVAQITSQKPERVN